MKAVALIFAILLTFCGNAAALEGTETFSPQFVAGEPHTFTQDFKQYFETMYAELNACTLFIQQEIYKEAMEQSVLERIEVDLLVLAKELKMSLEELRPHTIYVVKNAPNGVEHFDDRIYCTIRDIKHGAYYPALIGAALGTEEYWKTVGIAAYTDGCIYGEHADEEMLKAAYEQMGNLDILSLSDVYFIGGFATKEERFIARQTAISVCQYVLDRYGIQALVKSDCIAYKQEWLKQLGIDKTYEDPYYAILRGSQVRSSSQYPLVVKTSQGHMVYLKAMEDVQTAADVRLFLYDMAAGTQAVLDCIAEQAPEYAAAISNRGKIPLSIYCGNETGSFTDLSARVIQLKLGYGYLHEVGHNLIPTLKSMEHYSQLWKYEGLCNYFSFIVYPFHSYRKEFYHHVLCAYPAVYDEKDNSKTPNQKYWAHVAENYLSNASMPFSANDMDVPLFIGAMAKTAFQYQEELEESVWTWPLSASYTGLRNDNGNELTSMQAACFAEYLIDRYSLTAYLDYCVKEPSFDKAFGVSYGQAKAAWLEELWEK